MHDFGHARRRLLEKIEVRPLNRPDPFYLAADMHGRRREADLRAIVLLKMRGEFPVSRLDALEALEEIDVKEGAAELAVRDPLQAHILLGAHDLADALVLDRVQFGAPVSGRRRSAHALRAAAQGEDSCRHGRRETAETSILPQASLSGLLMCHDGLRVGNRPSPPTSLPIGCSEERPSLDGLWERGAGSPPRGKKRSQHLRSLALA